MSLNDSCQMSFIFPSRISATANKLPNLMRIHVPVEHFYYSHFGEFAYVPFGKVISPFVSKLINYPKGIFALLLLSACVAKC